MKSKKKVPHSLFSLRNYMVVFLGSAFVVTCCILMFSNEIETPELRKRAIATFFNLMFLSFILSTINNLWRRFTVGRPVKRILKATEQLTAGDFSVRIEPFHGFDSMNELDAIIENFNMMAQELSGVETLRTDFISSVSHELKTPLAIIQNYTTMLKTPDLPQEQRLMYAQNISDATKRLDELITNILKLNKLENQQIFLEKKEYLLNEQLCECLLGFEDLWEKKQLEIDAQLEDVPIRGDGELLSLVWNNLFSNAIKFTPTGGKISVLLEEEKHFVQVQIRDTGCGMTAEMGRHIFEKFYQGDSSHATQGNGLGLALVKRVIDIIGGEISVDSTLGEGSTFTVRLPREGV